MGSTIKDFLQVLPTHVGAPADFVYNNLIDEDGDKKLKHQEIFDYIQRHKADLKNWYDSKSKNAPSYILGIERKLLHDLTVDIPVSEISSCNGDRPKDNNKGRLFPLKPQSART